MKRWKERRTFLSQTGKYFTFVQRKKYTSFGMPYKEKEPERIFFTIGEVAKMFKVNTSLIRFWEKEFDILKPKKNKKGNRLFTKQDVDNLHIIYHLVKERGFKLEGAKQKLKQNKDEVVNSVEIVKSLKKIKNFLLEMKESL